MKHFILIVGLNIFILASGLQVQASNFKQFFSNSGAEPKGFLFSAHGQDSPPSCPSGYLSYACAWGKPGGWSSSGANYSGKFNTTNNADFTAPGFSIRIACAVGSSCDASGVVLGLYYNDVMKTAAPANTPYPGTHIPWGFCVCREN